MGRSRRFVIWLALVSALASGSLWGTAVGVSAQAGEASHWTAHRSGPRPTQLAWSLSCPRVDDCTVVTGNGAALEYDGSTWGRARTADHDLGALGSVSCPTRSFCAAVGGRLAVVERNGHWGHVFVSGDDMFAVSCPSVRWCMAVGAGGKTWRYDGHGWHRGPTSHRELARSLSCTSRTFCMDMTTMGRPSHFVRWNGKTWHDAGIAGHTTRLACGSRTLCMSVNGSVALRWNGHRWIRHEFVGWDPEQGFAVSCGVGFCQYLGSEHAAEFHHGWGRVTTGVGEDPVELSCAGRGHCVALNWVDTQRESTATLTGSTWTSSPYPDPVPVVDLLSCPTASFCMGASEAATTRVLRGGVWSAAGLPGGWSFVTQLSCTSPTFCLATNVDHSMAAWDGTSWSPMTAPGNPGLLACASSTFCLSVSNDAAWIWNGSSWSPGPTPSFPAWADLTNLTCRGTADCWVGTDTSQVAHLVGSTWGSPQTIAGPGTDDVNSVTVTCGTVSSCAAHDQFGHVFTWNDLGWSRPVKIGPVAGLSCASPHSCTASIPAGRVARWNGSRWTTLRAMPRGYSAGEGGRGPLSCPTNNVCYLADATGNTWIRR